jgi:tRNA(fMet)-specific endonuclease VapC
VAIVGLVVADTDLMIDFLSGVDPGRALVKQLLLDQRLAVTALTAFELCEGAADGDPLTEPDHLLFRRTIPLNIQAAIASARIARTLGERGRSIGVKDTLIAGTCLVFGLPLATRNRRHFERVPGLELAEV